MTPRHKVEPFVCVCVCEVAPMNETCVCVLLPLVAPAPPDLSNGKISSGVPVAGATVAYLCGFISQQPGASGGPALLHPIAATQDARQERAEDGPLEEGRFLPRAS